MRWEMRLIGAGLIAVPTLWFVYEAFVTTGTFPTWLFSLGAISWLVGMLLNLYDFE